MLEIGFHEDGGQEEEMAAANELVGDLLEIGEVSVVVEVGEEVALGEVRYWIIANDSRSQIFDVSPSVDKNCDQLAKFVNVVWERSRP